MGGGKIKFVNIKIHLSLSSGGKKKDKICKYKNTSLSL